MKGSNTIDIVKPGSTPMDSAFLIDEDTFNRDPEDGFQVKQTGPKSGPRTEVKNLAAGIPEQGAEEETEEAKKLRQDRIHNTALIRDFIIQEYSKNKGFKRITDRRIHEGTGLSESTVGRYRQEAHLGIMIQDSNAKFLAEDVFMGMAQAGMRGNPGAAKAYFQLLFGWQEGQTLNIQTPEPIQVVWGVPELPPSPDEGSEPK